MFKIEQRGKSLEGSRFHSRGQRKKVGTMQQLGESSILTNFLLPPAPLSAVISLEKFRELFPSELRESPQVRALYRELQHVRAEQADEVKRNIAAEAKRGERQKRQVARIRRRAVEGELMEGVEAHEIQMEADVCACLILCPASTV